MSQNLCWELEKELVYYDPFKTLPSLRSVRYSDCPNRIMISSFDDFLASLECEIFSVFPFLQRWHKIFTNLSDFNHYVKSSLTISLAICVDLLILGTELVRGWLRFPLKAINWFLCQTNPARNQPAPVLLILLRGKPSSIKPVIFFAALEMKWMSHYCDTFYPNWINW